MSFLKDLLKKRNALLESTAPLRKKVEDPAARERNQFKLSTEQILKEFASSDEISKEFEICDKLHRGIIHIAAESLNLVSFSIGIDEVDKRVLVYKKEHAPSAEEIDRLKKVSKGIIEEQSKPQQVQATPPSPKRRKAKRKAEENEEPPAEFIQLYGKKRDLRTVEECMLDLKRSKTDNNARSSGPADSKPELSHPTDPANQENHDLPSELKQ
eukprot:TRINITY_DN18844_c0_g1::TRINITY_DN18844_c0_g1_i1::g.1540::m.1540 TRINITY_DN18844_c0_g1::TRINITY_DN18844_c0_g1_i1::g.1540  ORF type:complete len:222 (+),score=5.73,sp/O75391/SPAG7_HUMAN/27.22/2e-08,R3H/PF01424.17/4.2e-10,R3H/PF01424.17/3.3e+03,Calmodulin_bind/PF07887.6/0.062 TRINITY_DN18844_c0_g1_i1:28-666(+)